jgi:hypothetical protein
MQATVRLRVEDNGGTGYATGTIIHRVENEALVLTCGHVFRDSNGQGKINVDLGFQSGEPVTVVGNLISFDARAHDIALVAIPCPLPVQPVPVAPEALVLQTGDQAFSVGCDQGAAPTIRTTTLKAVTRYSGVAKYDIVGRPADGRSGGGLFTSAGQLIGVCNAAAVEIDEGIYTGLESVYWQFASSNLTHLFRPQTAPLPNAATLQLASDPTSQSWRPGTMDAVARSVASESPVHNVTSRGDLSGTDHTAPGPLSIAKTGLPGAGSDLPVEMIVVIRSSDPSRDATFSVQNPDPQMIRELAKASQESSQQQAVQRLAKLPDLNPVTHRATEIRGQSPR